jgi:hypothetical protein
MLAALHQELAAGLLAQVLQHVQLLIKLLGSTARAGLGDLFQPFTAMASSRGYYKLHVTATGEPDTKTLQEIENVPGAAARFAANQFALWQVAKQQSHERTTP